MLRNFKLISFLALSLILCLAWACLVGTALSQPKFGGTLKVAVTTSPPTLDPHASAFLATREVGRHIFEGLTTFNAKYEVIPQLAERWTVSPDGKVYAFYLRKGILFHNGSELKAADVKASIERFVKVSPRRKDLEDLDQIILLDDYTLELRLKFPNGAFLAALAAPAAHLAIMPKVAVEGKDAGKAELIGTGPYKFVEWIPDRHVRIRRFDGYKPEEMPASGFGGKKIAYLDEILFIPVPEPGARVAGLETMDYDFATHLPAGSALKLLKKGQVEIVELGPFHYPIMYFNHAGIMKNLKLRQAIQAALNHGEIMIAASEGAGRLDPGIVFKEQIWYSDAGKELYDQRNPEKAKRLLEEAGYKGEPIIMITNTDYDYMYKAALVIERQLKKIGLNIKLQIYDWPGAIAVRKDLTKWDLFHSSHSIRFDPSVNDFYFLPETTFFAYSPPELRSLIEKGRRSIKFEDRYSAYAEIQRFTYENAAWVKLFDLNIFEGYQRYVKGYVSWVEMHFWNVWLEK